MNRHRWLMNASLATWGWLPAAPYVAAQDPAVGREDSTLERGIRVSPGRVLTVDLTSGGSLVVRGWERDSVRVRAHLAGRDWRDTKVHLDRIPGGVRLRSGLGGSALEKSTSHEFEIWVPSEVDLELQSAGGDVRIANVAGHFRGQTRGGSIVLEHVRGYAELSTRGGAIQISDSHLDGSVTTRGGAVQVERVTGGVRTGVENGPFESEEKRVRPVDKRRGGRRVIKAPGPGSVPR